MDPRIQLIELKQTWHPPIELKCCRPREVCLTGAGKSLQVLALILFLAGLVAGVILYVKASTDLETRQELLVRGKDTDAQVIRRWQTRGDHPQYWVEYAYRGEGETLRGRVTVGWGSWSRLTEASHLPVLYLPDEPGVHLIRGHEGGLLPIWVPFVIAGTLTATALLIAREIRRQRRLLAEGRPAPAVVTGHEKTQHGKTARYAFPLMSGAIVHGKTGPQKSPPPLGSIFCVLYEPDRVRHNGVYPLSLVRPRKMVSAPHASAAREHASEWPDAES